jgi:alkylhydroperoxidase family enzyme
VTQQGLTEDFYQHVADRHGYDYSEQERLAIEYAERFLLDHTRIDDAFFDRLRSCFSDAEILDLTVCIAAFMGLGRLLRVLGLDETCQVDVRPERPER